MRYVLLSLSEVILLVAFFLLLTSSLSAGIQHKGKWVLSPEKAVQLRPYFIFGSICCVLLSIGIPIVILN